MNAIAPYFDGAFAKVFGSATPVSGADNFNMARAQSLLTGDGWVCPPLTPREAAEVIRWHEATRPTFTPSPPATAYPSLPVAGWLGFISESSND